MIRGMTTAAFLSASVLAASAQDVAAPAGTYANDPNHTSVTWSLDHLGLSTYVGRINQTKMTLRFDPDDIAATRLTAVGDPAAIDTDFEGERDWDGELARKPEFFDAGAHPTIRFETTRVEPDDEGGAQVSGNLTMLGVTRAIVLDAAYVGSVADHPVEGGPAIGFSATGTIKRSAFGMTHLLDQGIADEVTITVDAEFLREGALDE